MEAGAVKKIKIIAEGSTIFVEVYSGSDAKTAETVKGKLKTWSTLDAAAKWVRGMGSGEFKSMSLNGSQNKKARYLSYIIGLPIEFTQICLSSRMATHHAWRVANHICH